MDSHPGLWPSGLKEGQVPEKPVLVVGTACQEGQGRKVTSPPSMGHMTQDPWDPAQWPRDMASMAPLSQDVMFWSLWKLRGGWNPHKAVWVGKGWDQGSGIFGSGVGFWQLGSGSAHRPHARL